LLSACLGGCGTDSFAPPPPNDLREVVAPTPPQGVKTKAETGAKPIELILAPRDAEAAAATAHFARTQAGYDGVLVKTETLEQNRTPADQADRVEAAIKEKPPALILEPAAKPDPRLSKLVEEAGTAGIPVVIVGPPLPGVKEEASSKSGDKKRAPVVRIGSVPFQDTAKQLVASAIRVAKNAKVDPKGGAILIYNESGDPYIGARVQAMKDALTEAGITSQHWVDCPLSLEEATQALKKTIEKESKATLIVPFDHRSYSVAASVTSALDPSRVMVVAGYISEEKSLILNEIANMAAVAEFRPAKLIRRAVQQATSLMRGEKVDPVVEMSINFIDSQPRTGDPSLRPTKKRQEADDSESDNRRSKK
jgi:ABC-type sugar transport system substrate-binding protein